MFSSFNFKERGNFGETEFSFQIGNILIQAGSIDFHGNQYTLVFPKPYKQNPKILVSNWFEPGSDVGHSGRNKFQCPFYSRSNRISVDWVAIGIA